MCCSNYQVSKVLDFCPIFLIIQPYCQKVKKIKMKMQCSCDFSAGRGINVICKSRYFNLLIGQINEKMPNIKNIYIFNRHPRNSHVSQKNLLVDDIFDIVNNKVLSEGTFTPRLFWYEYIELLNNKSHGLSPLVDFHPFPLGGTESWFFTVYCLFCLIFFFKIMESWWKRKTWCFPQKHLNLKSWLKPVWFKSFTMVCFYQGLSINCENLKLDLEEEPGWI